MLERLREELADGNHIAAHNVTKNRMEFLFVQGHMGILLASGGTKGCPRAHQAIAIKLGGTLADSGLAARHGQQLAHVLAVAVKCLQPVEAGLTEPVIACSCNTITR